VELAETLLVTLTVASAFEALGVRYFLGGSLASSLHGIPRATMDADLVADLGPEHVQPLVALLEESFYIAEERVRDAVRRRASFNAIHLKALLKVDVFVLGEDPYSRLEMERRRLFPLPGLPARELPVASAEDIVLQKLRWFVLAGGTSQRQWADLLGVLKVQRGAVDLAYLDRWAGELGVKDLLVKALGEGGASS
jgi:hypothetical protein